MEQHQIGHFSLMKQYCCYMDGYSFVHLLSSGVVIVCVRFGIAHAKKTASWL